MDPVGSIIAVVVGIVVVVIVLLFYFYWRQSKQIKTLVDVLKAEKIASNTWSVSGRKRGAVSATPALPAFEVS